MTPAALYQFASVILLLFAAGHTFGFLKFKPPTPEGLAVRDAMNGVSFEFKGKRYTYGGFYRGFGLFVTAYLLFSAFLAWHLAGLATTAPSAIGALGWAFAAVQLATLILSWIYFFPVTAVFSVVAVAPLAWAAWLLR